MRPWAALLIAVLGFLICPGTARASGDFGCSPGWKFSHADYTGCDSMTMLSPGNDTRVNLALLPRRPGVAAAQKAKDGAPLAPLFDWASLETWTYPAPPKFGDSERAAGEGSRCLSDADGTAAFAAAVAATSRLDPVERTALIAARRALRPTCIDTASAAPAERGAAQVRSAPGKAFAAYLQGASAFYAGDFDTAAVRFGALVGSREPRTPRSWAMQRARRWFYGKQR